MPVSCKVCGYEKGLGFATISFCMFWFVLFMVYVSETNINKKVEKGEQSGKFRRCHHFTVMQP